MNRRSPVYFELLEWVQQCRVSFTFDDLPESLRAQGNRVRQRLVNLVKTGTLRRVSYGTYQFDGVQAVPQKPKGRPKNCSSRGKPGSLRSVVVWIAQRLGPKAKWTPAEMEQWVGQQDPGRVSTPERRTDLRVALVDMYHHGELIREGTPPLVTYRLGGKLLPREETNTEPPLNIRVPRDAVLG